MHTNLGTHRHRELCCEHIGDGLSEEIIPKYVDNNSEESCTIASKHALTPRAGHLTHYHLDTYHPMFTLINSRGQRLMPIPILRHSAWSLGLPPLRRVGAQTPDSGRC